MDDARMTILRLVAEGKLTAEEADRLFDAMNAPSTPSVEATATDTLHETVASMNPNGDLEDHLTESFSVEPGGSLVLEADRGTISVRAAETSVVEVEVTRTVRTQDPAEARALLNEVEIQFMQQGNDVHIHARVPREQHRWWDRDGRHLNLHFLMTVPLRYNLDLKTAGGSISVGDLEGEVRSKTSGGHVHIGHIQGLVWGKTSGGDITLTGCTGTADVKTSGGSIRIGAVDGDVLAYTSGGSIDIERVSGRVTANTSGGSITVGEAMNTVEAITSGGSVAAYLARQPQDYCRLETSGGDVTVYLAEEVGVNVNARTSGGQVVTEFPITFQGELRKSALQAAINGGGPELLMRTSGGSVYLRKK